jgi:hypothetical protein
MEDTVNGHSRVISHSVVALVRLTCTAKLFAARHASAIPGTAQITVLYDAFGKTPGVQKDWGYSALIEFAGLRQLWIARSDCGAAVPCNEDGSDCENSIERRETSPYKVWHPVAVS